MMRDNRPRSDPPDRDDDEARRPVDPRIDSEGREGLTGTAPQSLYGQTRDREQMTIPPDGLPMDVQPCWRQDFPIDWPQDHYVARRDFTKFLGLTSLAFVAGHVWIAAQNWWRGRRGTLPVQKVANLADIPVGTTRVFHYPGEHDPCILVRTDESTLLAYGQQCTHLSCAVVPRPEQGDIHCPCHEGYFDLRTGRPIAGPPRRPLPLITLDIKRNGDIMATGVKWRTV